MQRSGIGLWIGAACTVTLTVLPLWFAGQNLWIYLRMRTIPVEVTQSLLRIDAAEAGSAVENLLLLDLKTTDSSARQFRTEAYLRRATYPEEAYDELAAWAPGTRHVVYQVRGAATRIHLPGPGQSPELGNAGVLLAVSCFPAVFAVVLLAILSEEDSWLRRRGFNRVFGVWSLFAGFGMLLFLGLTIFVWFELPKRLTWVMVSASAVNEVMPTAEAEPRTIPDNVEVTTEGRRILDAASYRVLRFVAPDGRTLHAGIGGLHGPYEELAGACPPGKAACEFHLNPANRWDVESNVSWDEQFFLPAGLFLFLASVFSGVGWFIRSAKH